ncbi:MAG: hypothetical protein LBU80_05320 [Rikenellaceae bacterium]|jgi:hypothetical protein|nr:hypothetical protein [Rikenellaceae bacterium]
MTTIFIKVFENYVVDFVTFDPHLQDYDPIEVEEIPFDLMNGCYRTEDGALVRDETKRTAIEAERSEVARLTRENTNLRSEIDALQAEIERLTAAS